MQIIDLSHIIAEDMPVYPGTEPPVFMSGTTVEKDGYRERKITMFSHTGTHMDAPAHILADGKTLDEFPAGHFYGQAWLLRCPPGEEQIGVDLLRMHQRALEQVDFLLIHTGWDRHWGREAYFSGYPVLSAEAAIWLAGFGLKGVGLDAISADTAESESFPVHKALLGHDIIIIENLTNMGSLPSGFFRFSCFPLPFISADGSPVRAVAYIEE